MAERADRPDPLGVLVEQLQKPRKNRCDFLVVFLHFGLLKVWGEGKAKGVGGEVFWVSHGREHSGGSGGAGGASGTAADIDICHAEGQGADLGLGLVEDQADGIAVAGAVCSDDFTAVFYQSGHSLL